MRLIVFGATGATGRQLVTQALELSHEVTAFVRDASRLTARSGRLRAITGDVMDVASVESAVPGHDAVLVALGTMPEGREERGRRRPAEPVCSVGTRQIVASMVRHSVNRLIVETSLAVGSSREDSRFGAATFIRWILRDVMNDKERQEATVRDSGLDWTIIRPARLTNDRPAMQVRAGESLAWSLLSTVSRADVAAYMLRALRDTSTYRKSISLIG